LENVLFSVLGVPVYAYGLMLGLGVLGGSSLAMREARRRGIGIDRMFDYILAASLIFLAAGRGAQTISQHGAAVITRPWLFVTEIFEGVHLTAGFAGVIVFTLWFIWHRRLIPTVFFDALTPPLALALSLSQLGSDVFGRSTDMLWAVSIGGFQMHPVQLYAAVGYYTMFTLLWRMRRSTRYDGQLFVTFLTMTSWQLWILSHFRDVGEQSLSPWVWLLLALAMTSFCVLLFMKSPRPFGWRRRSRGHRAARGVSGMVFYGLGLGAMILFFFLRVQ